MRRLAQRILNRLKRGRVDGASFEERFLDWQESKRREADDHLKLLNAFLGDGGARLSDAAKISSSLAGRFDFSQVPSLVGLSPMSADYQQALKSLRTDGYAILPQQLSPDVVQQLREAFSVKPLKMVSDDPSVNGRTAMLNLGNPQAEKYEVATKDVLENSLARALMLDGGMLAIVQDYLGSAPVVDIATSWFSFPVGRSSREAATQFHFDLDRTRWVKVFYFLTDVNERTGAHLFVPRSQADGAIPSRLLSKGYSRLTDGEVESAFPINSWKTIGGPAGSILLEDTRGLHKGLPLLEGHRLVLQFQYSVDLFGGPSHLAGLPRPSDLRGNVVGIDHLMSAFNENPIR